MPFFSSTFLCFIWIKQFWFGKDLTGLKYLDLRKDSTWEWIQIIYVNWTAKYSFVAELKFIKHAQGFVSFEWFNPNVGLEKSLNRPYFEVFLGWEIIRPLVGFLFDVFLWIGFHKIVTFDWYWVHYVRDIRDPEHPYSLEQLSVLSEESISVDEKLGRILLVFFPFLFVTVDNHYKFKLFDW